MNQHLPQQTTTTLTQESAHAAMVVLKDRIALFPGGSTTKGTPVPGSNWQIWVNDMDTLCVAGYVDVQAADKFAETSDYFTFRLKNNKMVFSRNIIFEESVADFHEAVNDLFKQQLRLCMEE